MKKSNFIYSLVVILMLFTISFVHALENVPPHKLIIALELQEQIDFFKEKSEKLEKQLLNTHDYLLQAESENVRIDKEKKIIEEEVYNLINSLEATMHQFQTALDIIEEYELKVQEQQKHLDSQKDIFFVLCVIGITRMVFVIIGWILAWRKVKVPFWLDILL